MLRSAIVVTVTLTAAGCCPGEIEEGDDCMFWHDECQAQGEPGECGLNGFACEEGKWSGQFTYCNPPEPPPPATASPPATATASAEPDAPATSSAPPVATPSSTGAAAPP